MQQLFGTSSKRIFHGAQVTFNSTAPKKLTSTLDLLNVFYSLMSQLTRVTKRSAFLGRYNITSA